VESSVIAITKFIILLCHLNGMPCVSPSPPVEEGGASSGNKFKNLPNVLQLVPHFGSFLG